MQRCHQERYIEQHSCSKETESTLKAYTLAKISARKASLLEPIKQLNQKGIDGKSYLLQLKRKEEGIWVPPRFNLPTKKNSGKQCYENSTKNIATVTRERPKELSSEMKNNLVDSVKTTADIDAQSNNYV